MSIIFLIIFFIFSLISLIGVFFGSEGLTILSIFIIFIVSTSLILISGNNKSLLLPVILFTIIGSFSLHVFSYLSINPVEGVDERKYFLESVDMYSFGFLNYMERIVSSGSLTENIWAIVFSLMAFIGSSLFYLTQSISTEHLWVINYISLFLLALSISKIYNVKFYHISFLFLVSPYFTHYTYYFFKDIVTMATILLSLHCYVKKKYILFFILLAVSTLLRPYALTIFLSFYFLLRPNTKFIIATLISCAMLCALTYGLYPLKYIKMVIYFILSPNPFNNETYSDATLLLPLVETIILIFALLYILLKDYRFFFLIISCVCITAFAVYLVDTIYAITHYGSGSVIAENLYRKKLPIMPLIYTSILMFFLRRNRVRA